MHVEKRNITLSMPVALLRAARRLAVDRGTSLSGLMVSALEGLVEEERLYRDAMDSELAVLEQGLPLGTGGRAGWTRDELHER